MSDEIEHNRCIHISNRFARFLVALGRCGCTVTELLLNLEGLHIDQIYDVYRAMTDTVTVRTISLCSDNSSGILPECKVGDLKNVRLPTFSDVVRYGLPVPMPMPLVLNHAAALTHLDISIRGSLHHTNVRDIVGQFVNLERLRVRGFVSQLAEEFPLAEQGVSRAS